MKNKNFIFSVTISEIIIILFFLLALLSSKKITELIEVSNNQEKEIKAQEEKIKAQKETLNMIVEKDNKINQYFDELVNIKIYMEKIASLENEIKEIKEKEKNKELLDNTNQKLKEEINKKEELLKILTNKNDTKEIKKILEESVKNKIDKENIAKLKEEIKKLKKQKSELKEKLVSANIDNSKKTNEINQLKSNETKLNQFKDKLEKQVAYYKRRGLDYPPCWSNEEGKPEYLFHITLKNKNIFVKSHKWNDDNKKEALNMKNINKIIDKQHNINSFINLAYPIYQQSKKDECRHFVVIRNEIINNNLKDYKNKLSKIENIFYKYMEK